MMIIFFLLAISLKLRSHFMIGTKVAPKMSKAVSSKCLKHKHDTQRDLQNPVSTCFLTRLLTSGPTLHRFHTDLPLPPPPEAAEGAGRRGRVAGGAPGRGGPLLPREQGAAADSQGPPEDGRRLRRALDVRVLRRAVGREPAAGRGQAGAPGGHGAGGRHHLQEDSPDQRTEAQQ